MRLTTDVIRALVAEAARAPSAHNVQPARWRIEPTGEAVLLRARDRVLPVADPTNHDLRIGLGSAWEGLAIAASRRGWTLSEPELCRDHDAPFIPVARGTLAANATAEDELARWVECRRSYRGVFAPTPPEFLEVLHGLRAPDLAVITGRDAIADCAALYDHASWLFLREPAYEAELYRWTRFSARDPNWARDGLSADCLSLSAVQRAGAAMLLRPAVFALAKKAGIARPLVSESSQIRSAAAILLFTAERAETDFAVGRRFYRLWLELTAAGLAVAPMSALADCRSTARQLMRDHGIPATRRLVNVLRAGTPPRSGIPRSARLPTEELFVAKGLAP